MIKVLSVVPVFGYHDNLPVLLNKLKIISESCVSFKTIVILNDGINLESKITNCGTFPFDFINDGVNYNVYGFINKINEMYPGYDFFWFHDQDSYPLEVHNWIDFFNNTIIKNNLGVLSPLKLDEFNNINNMFYLYFNKYIGLYDYIPQYIPFDKCNVFGHAGNLLSVKILPIDESIICATDCGDFFYCIKSILKGCSNLSIKLKYHHPDLISKNKISLLKKKFCYLPSNGYSVLETNIFTPYEKLYRRLNLFFPFIYIKAIMIIKSIKNYYG